MSDYISREAAVAIADYAADIYPYDKDPQKPETYSDYNQGWNDACDYIRGKLDDEKSADVELVRHGQWLRTDDDWSSLVTIQCSACGGEWCFEVDEDVQLLGYNYCPGCGCKMDLEGENNDELKRGME